MPADDPKCEDQSIAESRETDFVHVLHYRDRAVGTMWSGSRCTQFAYLAGPTVLSVVIDKQEDGYRLRTLRMPDAEFVDRGINHVSYVTEGRGFKTKSEAVRSFLDRVGLPPDSLDRYEIR